MVEGRDPSTAVVLRIREAQPALRVAVVPEFS